MQHIKVCHGALAALLIVLILHSSTIRAQFLFTYEINNQDDESRAPKSSLFDPGAFKIVTPSQLQSSYQKISSQLDNQVATAPSASIGQPTSGTAASVGQATLSPLSGDAVNLSASPRQSTEQTSLLKQTSAALQSFADLFSFGSQNSPPSEPHLPVSPQIDQQAEARSLHEHWTQQQQQNTHHLQQPATTSGVSASASPALQSFTTGQPSSTLLQPQQPAASTLTPANEQPAPPASYWLTANPLNAPDGNYLVEIKQTQQHQQPQLKPTPATLVDNLLSLGHRSPQLAPPSHPSLPANTPPHHSSTSATSSRQQQQVTAPAQSSFLATPTSYYPPATTSSEPSGRQQFSAVTPPASLSTRLPAREFAVSRAVSAPIREIPADSQLRPPANTPENFPPRQQQLLHSLHPQHTNSLHHHNVRSQPVQITGAHLKSAEESLISFRQHQAQQQKQQQQPQFNTREEYQARQHPSQPQQQHHQGAQQVFAEPEIRSPTSAPQVTPASASTNLGEIPKVSPQIYESFLLQQKDQHEKHMELLKQQQELNKLMAQKQKQDAAAATNGDQQRRQRKKKEEAEKEARKKQLLQRDQEIAAARKLKAEQEERKRREEEESKRRADEERRYREYLEARERERQERAERERRERELAEQQRKREQEERELKLRMERELAERRRLEAERAAAEEAEREQKRKLDEKQKYANYLRQQEELRKLLELKQREDEAQQQRRRQAAQQQQLPQQQQTSRAAQTERANRLAQQHRERAQASRFNSWGTRGRAVSTPAANTEPSSPSSLDSTYTEAPAGINSAVALGASSMSPSTQSETPASTPAPTTSTRAPTRERSRSQQVAAAQRRQRTQGDERLIRQKIPLYSGAGKYGLYRNESLSQDLAALLASVTLPPSSTTASTSVTYSSTQAPAPLEASFPSGPVSSTPSNFILSDTSSLSPLLNAANSATSGSQIDTVSSTSSTGFPGSQNEPVFDDDVPRRPARGLTANQLSRNQQQTTPVSITTSASTTTSTTAPSTTQRALMRTTPLPRAGGRQRKQSGARSTSESSAAASAISTARSAHIGLASLPPDSDNDGIPGRAGVEYPVLSAVPPTSFSCSKQPLNGYYADTETACQVVHLCQGGVQSSILCPNGTIFNQEKFSCQWWYEVNCSRAPNFYQLNDNLYKVGDFPTKLAPTTESPDDEDGDEEEEERKGRQKTTRTPKRKSKADRSNLLSAST